MNRIVTYPFTESFIGRLIDDIEAEYIKNGKDLSRLAIVFGGKRPSLFVKRELARRMGKSFCPPKFFTIDEFIAYTVRKKETFNSVLDLDNCYLLYQLIKKHTTPKFS